MALSVVSIFIDRALVNFYYIQLTKSRKQLIKIITFYWFYLSQRIVIVIFPPCSIFFPLRFNRLSHFITRIRQLLDHNSITRLSSYSSDYPPEWSIGICLISVSAFHPFIPPLKGMCLFIVPLFLAAPTVNQSLSLPFSPPKFLPRISFLTSPTSIKLNGNMKLYYIRYHTNYRGEGT